MKLCKLFAGLIVLTLSITDLTFSKVLAYESFRVNQDTILIADFEGDDYGDWQVTGEAFGAGPAQGTLANQQTVSGFLGVGLVNTFYNGDATTGTLTSPVFTIERSYINFLIGGGGFAGQTCINLLLDEQVVRTAVGPNTTSGGSEELEWCSWDVSDLVGESVQIKIVDEATGSWGHINIDHILQSNVKSQTITYNKEKSIEFNQKYLNIPVETGASKRVLFLSVDGERVRELSVELASGNPDFWVYLDVSEFQGKEGTLQIDKYDSTWTVGFDAIYQDDTFPGQEDLYQEKLRPQFHFTSRRGWNNDTNGMVYYDGEYHLFYQHNPYGWSWGNMTWGHAVSTDMVHWQELGDAIHPDAMGTIYSGSAVVDEQNTAGLRSGDKDPIVCIYTSAGGKNQWSDGEPFTQSIAYSNDSGRTWTKYTGNPVMEHIVGTNRDPKVFWHEPTQRWAMVLYLSGSTMGFFTSSDLKSWTKQSEVDGFFECPELFELPVDGDASNTKWVLYGANGAYMVGQFDGTQFVPDGDAVTFQYGNCFYASQTFNNIPQSDGRRIQMAWGKVAMSDMPFNQMVLFPVSLTLHTTDDGIRMFANPIDEIEDLHQQHWDWSELTVSPGDDPLTAVEGKLFHIKAELKPQETETCTFTIRGIPIVYDVSAQQLTCQGKSASLEMTDGKITLEILVDRMSIEIYANGGRVYMPIGVDLVDNAESLGYTNTGGDAVISALDIYTLKSIWF